MIVLDDCSDEDTTSNININCSGAKFINDDKTYFANRFFTRPGKKEYFDDLGDNMQKAFLRAPLDFAYISSHFNPNRMHPVLHKIRAHNGVDYAAKRGSPVRTTGDGTISYLGQRGGCGKEIIIKHSNEYSTRYCHLDKLTLHSTMNYLHFYHEPYPYIHILV